MSVTIKQPRKAAGSAAASPQASSWRPPPQPARRPATRQPATGQRKGWIVLFATLFCGIIVIMNQFKVPTFMGALMHDFGTDPGTTGWLMSVIAVAGIITAFPSAFLLNRFGPSAWASQAWPSWWPAAPWARSPPRSPSSSSAACSRASELP